MKWGDVDFKYSDNVLCCKWYDNKSAMLLASNIEGIDKCSTVERFMKGSSLKTSITCSSLMKFHNKDMGDNDLMNQKTAGYRLDCRSKCKFYLRIFFDLVDVALVNNPVYQQLNDNLNLLDFKIVLANSLIGKYSNHQRAFPRARQLKPTSQTGPAGTPDHLREYQFF